MDINELCTASIKRHLQERSDKPEYEDVAAVMAAIKTSVYKGIKPLEHYGVSAGTKHDGEGEWTVSILHNKTGVSVKKSGIIVDRTYDALQLRRALEQLCEEFKVEVFNVKGRCPRCGVGADTNGDGDCLFCARSNTDGTWRSRSFPLSKDGTELYWVKDGLPTKTTVTVENYCKWYELHLVYPNGDVEAVDFPDCGNYEELGPPYVDHVPNPRHVFAWALAQDYTVDDAGLAAMCAEWDELRKEWAGLEGYEIHPVDTLGCDWRGKVAAHLTTRMQEDEHVLDK